MIAGIYLIPAIISSQEGGFINLYSCENTLGCWELSAITTNHNKIFAIGAHQDSIIKNHGMFIYELDKMGTPIDSFSIISDSFFYWWPFYDVFLENDSILYSVVNNVYRSIDVLKINLNSNSWEKLVLDNIFNDMGLLAVILPWEMMEGFE